MRSRRSADAAGREEHNLVLTARLPAALAIFDVIAGCDPADPVTAASQGKRADSYLRFLDKDGARGARLGVVRQLWARWHALARNVSGSRRQGRAAAVGSVNGPSPDRPVMTRMRRKPPFARCELRSLLTLAQGLKPRFISRLRPECLHLVRRFVRREQE